MKSFSQTCASEQLLSDEIRRRFAVVDEIRRRVDLPRIHVCIIAQSPKAVERVERAACWAERVELDLRGK